MKWVWLQRHPVGCLSCHCRYAEKQVGYVACSVFLNEVCPLWQLLLRSSSKLESWQQRPAAEDHRQVAGLLPLVAAQHALLGSRNLHAHHAAPNQAEGRAPAPGHQPMPLASLHPCPSFAQSVHPSPEQKDEFLRLVINSVRNDLISRNEAFQCLALDFIANGGLGGQLAC